MKPIEIILPILPPSKNTWEGRHWKTRYNQGQRLYQEIWGAVRSKTPCDERMPRFFVPVVVSIEFHLPDRRRRDIQNLLHPGLFDSLKSMGLIIDDSAEWMELEVSSKVNGLRQTVIKIREREEPNE